MVPAGTVLPEDVIQRVQRRLVDEGADPNPTALARALRAESAVLLTDAEMLHQIRLLQRELVGAGPLSDLLADPATTDVVVNAPGDVRVDRGSGWQLTGVTFPDEAAVQRLARRLATAAGRRLDDAHPHVDARLADGTRLHAVLAPVAASGTCLSLRVLRPVRHDLDALRDSGTLPGVTHPTLCAVLRAALSFVVSGGTGSGKTTLLSALLAAVPVDERIVTVEDAEELRPPHAHVIRLVARQANVEGAGVISVRDLVRQALRMRPDRIVVGEVRGAEVVDLLAALNTGHDGSAGTLHANAAADVPARFEALASLGGIGRDAVHAQLAGAVRVVMHIRREGQGRVLHEIAVLRRDSSGFVAAEPAIVAGRPDGPGAAVLAGWLADRGEPVPW
ncbi:TadA family conjugal transfer-associated ATPase [Nakamurella sp. GG22]